MDKQLLQRRAVGLTPAKPVYRKRRRLALAAERQAGHRKSSTTSAPSRSDQLTRAAALPLNKGGAPTIGFEFGLMRCRAPHAVVSGKPYGRWSSRSRPIPSAEHGRSDY
jgi:hypothetical protein